MSIEYYLPVGQITETQTTVIGPTGEFKLNHYFMPSLATEIGLREGVIFDTSTIKEIEQALKITEESGLWRWNDSKLIDFDDTIVARNVLTLLGMENKTRIPLSLSNKGGTYTYLGGIKAKPNNTVDLIINARILDSISNIGINTNNNGEIFNYLNTNKDKLFEPIENISKYYISEGFLIYVVSKIATQISIELDELIEYKLDKLNTIADIELALLASPKNKQLQEKYKTIENSLGLFLFQEPTTQNKFRSLMLEQIINLSAKNINGVNFDNTTAKIYSVNGEELYPYKKHSQSLDELMNLCGIKTNDQLTELAIGTGNFLQHISKKYNNIFGIDSSSEMLRYAKNKVKNRSEIKLLNANNFVKQSKAIYSINFIDLYGSENVECWSDSVIDTKKILENISKNLEKKGVFFLHKKEDKKTKGFKLKQWSVKKENTIKHIYLFQNSDITFRRTYTKNCIALNEFETILNELNLKKIQENESWIAYEKQ